ARREELQPAAVQREILQREAGSGVDGLVVVDDRHLPPCHARRGRGGLVLEQGQEFGLFGHQSLRIFDESDLAWIFTEVQRRTAGRLTPLSPAASLAGRNG